MWILAAMALAAAGLLSRRVRELFGLLFWAALVVTLITLYGMML